jgi:hypothetical protein
MPRLMSWPDVMRAQINKEAEFIAAQKPDTMPEVDNKKILAAVKAARVRHYNAGIYNFCKYVIKSYLP